MIKFGDIGESYWGHLLDSLFLHSNCHFELVFPGLLLCHYYYAYKNKCPHVLFVFLCTSQTLYSWYYTVQIVMQHFFPSLSRFRCVFINLFSKCFIVWADRYSFSSWWGIWTVSNSFALRNNDSVKFIVQKSLYTYIWVSLDSTSRAEWLDERKWIFSLLLGVAKLLSKAVVPGVVISSRAFSLTKTWLTHFFIFPVWLVWHNLLFWFAYF